jgi:hypothetical protein
LLPRPGERGFRLSEALGTYDHNLHAAADTRCGEWTNTRINDTLTPCTAFTEQGGYSLKLGTDGLEAEEQ